SAAFCRRGEAKADWWIIARVGQALGIARRLPGISRQRSFLPPRGGESGLVDHRQSGPGAGYREAFAW
ncbi:hypothetical protein CKJ89_39555, partial [Klebsiella pneumoniae]